MVRRTQAAIFVLAAALIASAAGAALLPAAAQASAADRTVEEPKEGVSSAVERVDAERVLIQFEGAATADPAPIAGNVASATPTAATDGQGGPLGLLPPGVLMAVGYSRHDDTSPLENPTRRRIDEEIERTPGVYVSALAETVDASRSTVRYHLRVLERENRVFAKKIHGKQRFFPAGSDAPAVAAALADDASSSVVEAVAQCGPATVSELAEVLDRSPSTVSYHLSRLEEEGVVDRERRGESVVTTLSASASAHLRPEADVAPPTDGPAVAGDD